MSKNKTEKPAPIHYSKTKYNRTVLFCREVEGVWGYDTTGIQSRVTCPQCKKLLGIKDDATTN